MLKTIVEDTTAAVEKLTKNQIQSQQLRDELPALEVLFVLYCCWIFERSYQESELRHKLHDVLHSS